MPRTPAGRLLRASSRRWLHERGPVPGSVHLSRRGLLGALAGAGLVGCGGAGPSPGGTSSGRPTVPTGSITSTGTTPSTETSGGPTVAIVGGGLAGLNCCHRLAERGVYATVYEASAGTGGRIRSVVSPWGHGLTVEEGAEFINSSDAEIWALISELGLQTWDSYDDLRAWDPNLGRDVPLGYQVHLGGRSVPVSEVQEALLPVWQALTAELAGLPGWWELTWLNGKEAVVLDQTPMLDWLARKGFDPLTLDWVAAVALGEFGLEPSDLSVFGLAGLFLDDGQTLWDTRHHIVGGNQAITQALTERYADRVVTEHRLLALRTEADGRYRLVFEGQGEVVADVVVLAIPFTVLRTVELDLTLPEVQRQAIDGLSYGMNAKLILPVDTRFWRDALEDGYSLTDLGYQTSWDAARASSAEGGPGAILSFRGGAAGRDMAVSGVETLADDFRRELELLYPGCTKHFGAGAPILAHWPSAPYSLGTYSGFTVGQQTAFGGAEGLPFDGVFFAGEHTASAFRGYMQGAAETGARAAAEVALRLGL